MPNRKRVAIIGGGPAGLMAAEVISRAGGAAEVHVDLFEAMPSLARKFLLAGKGGMNITHSEPAAAFRARYGTRQDRIAPLLDGFGPEALCEWIHGLGIDTFVGSSGRVFPTGMKAAPLLRTWLHRLRQAGVAVAPLRPSNCGFDAGWSKHLRERFAGQPVKPVLVSFTDAAGGVHRQPGEFMITEYGVEGGLIYALSAPLRETIEQTGSATLTLDLLPGHSMQRVIDEVARPRGSRSLSSHLQSRLGLKGVKMALLHECIAREDFADAHRLAAFIKALPLRLIAPRPLDEAISSAGGVVFEALDEHLMVRRLPGVFCAGEMLDWEAPTGGYLLTACFASGHAAGLGALTWLHKAIA